MERRRHVEAEKKKMPAYLTREAGSRDETEKRREEKEEHFNTTYKEERGKVRRGNLKVRDNDWKTNIKRSIFC